MNIWLIIAIYLVSGVVMSIITDKVITSMLKSAIYKYDASDYDLLVCVDSKWKAIAMVVITVVFWPIGLPIGLAVVAVKYNKIRKGV